MNATTAEGAEPALTYQSDRAFLGHPRGLGYLSFAEAWERTNFPQQLGRFLCWRRGLTIRR